MGGGKYNFFVKRHQRKGIMHNMNSNHGPYNEIIKYLQKLNPFGDYLKHLLKTLSVSQAQLAVRLDISQATISYWLRGERLPKINTLHKICEALELSGPRRAVLLSALLETRTTKDIVEFGMLGLTENNSAYIQMMKNYSIHFNIEDIAKQDNEIEAVTPSYNATLDKGGRK